MGDRRGLRQSVPGVPIPTPDVSGDPPFSQAEPLKPCATSDGGADRCPCEDTPEDGVWVVYDKHAESVHNSEAEAIREAHRPRKVAFVPFGSELWEAQ